MKLLNYWPRLLQEIKEFKYLADAEQPEFDKFWLEIRETPDEFFLDTMTIYGVERWEKILQIIPQATDDLEDRRFRIKARLAERLPYTWRRMIEQLDMLVGRGNYRAELYANEYWLNIGLALIVKSIYNRYIDIKRYPFTYGELQGKTYKQIKDVWFYPHIQIMYTEIEAMLRRMIPANMTLTLFLMYNRYIDIKNKNLTYADLKGKTYLDIKEEVLAWE